LHFVFVAKIQLGLLPVYAISHVHHFFKDVVAKSLKPARILERLTLV